MKGSILKKLKVPAFFLIGFGLLYLVYRDKDLGQMWEDIKQANFYYIALSFVMGYLAIVSRGIRWTLLIDSLGYKSRKDSAVHAVAFGYFANLGVPRSGEIARCTALQQSEGVPVDKLFGTVILERVIDSFILLIFIALAFFLNIDVFKAFINQLLEERAAASGGEESHLLLILGIVVGVVVLAFLLLRKRIAASPFGQKVLGFIAGITDGFKSILKLKQKGWFIFHTAFIWIMYFLMAYVVCFSLPATSRLTLGDGLFITVAGGLGMIVPAPGGTGSYHAAITLAFVALGISGVLGDNYLESETASGLGAQFAAIIWSAQTLMIIIGGLIGLLMLSLKKKNDAAR